jgi:crotonobetainyl-CoA:carnitine CoA-transferase CaiB-like acyl-CoA transferase
MGADVIKIETPEGDSQRRTGRGNTENMSPQFMGYNRNKRSVVLDLKKKPALEALLRLVDKTDVFVHAMRPAAAERLGIGYQAISTRNPRVIYAYGSGFRKDGPRAEWPAYDDVVQGTAGIAGLVQRVTGEARFAPLVLVDQLCGYALASAIGMALYHRERSGEGQEVQVPMFETAVAFVMHQHLWGKCFDPPVSEMGYTRVLSPRRKPYATKDGYICVLAVSDDQWRRLLGAIDRAELAQDPRFATIDARTQNIEALYSILETQVKGRSTAEWRERFDAADIPNGPVNSLEDLFADPYLNESGFWRRNSHPTEGAYIDTAVPNYFSRSPGGVRRLPPKLGEHTREVLAEAGLSSQEIDQLTASARGGKA